MQWNSLEHFLSMGGYGAYVWSSYGVTLAVIVIEVLWLRSRRRAAARDALRLAQTERRA